MSLDSGLEDFAVELKERKKNLLDSLLPFLEVDCKQQLEDVFSIYQEKKKFIKEDILQKKKSLEEVEEKRKKIEKVEVDENRELKKKAYMEQQQLQEQPRNKSKKEKKAKKEKKWKEDERLEIEEESKLLQGEIDVLILLKTEIRRLMEHFLDNDDIQKCLVTTYFESSILSGSVSHVEIANCLTIREAQRINFKKLDSIQSKLKVSLLIGSNGAGKTNIAKIIDYFYCFLGLISGTQRRNEVKLPSNFQRTFDTEYIRKHFHFFDISGSCTIFFNKLIGLSLTRDSEKQFSLRFKFRKFDLAKLDLSFLDDFSCQHQTKGHSEGPVFGILKAISLKYSFTKRLKLHLSSLFHRFFNPL